MRLDHLLSMENVKSSHEGLRIRDRQTTDVRHGVQYLIRCSIFSDPAEGHAAEEPRGCSSAGRAPALQAGGQEFDSPHLHQGTKEDEQLECRYVKHNGRIAQVVRAHA